MSAASSAAMAAAIASQPHDFVTGAQVGKPIAGGLAESSLVGLLVPGEEAVLAADGEAGGVLLTTARVLVAERVGILNKRMAVKSFRRDAITAFAIDVDRTVTVTLFGASFGKAALIFDEGFDPMLLTGWLGETLVGTTAQN